MPVTPSVARMIGAHESLAAVVQEASAHGYAPMQKQALDMVLRGITSLDEARRVVFLDVAHGRPEPFRDLAA